MAPGHGQEDYNVCLKLGIPVFSPGILIQLKKVDENARFTADAGHNLAGEEVLKGGNVKVVQLLKERNLLVKEEEYIHNYPYDWRTKKPIIFRYFYC